MKSFRPGEVRINGANVFINDKNVASLEPMPPPTIVRAQASAHQTHTAEGLGAFPKGKPGQLVCVFQGSGEAADVPKSPNPKAVGSGGHGRLVCYVDGKEVFDEPASNVTLPELDYKQRKKNWRFLRNTRESSMPAPTGTYTMSSLQPSKLAHRNVIHLGITSRNGIEIHSMKRGSKFFWADTQGCIRVQEAPLRKLGTYLEKQPGLIKIEEGR